LLEVARSSENPFEGCIPQQPNRVDVRALDGFYDRMEALGARQFAKLGVVMVAGGLGERLGFNGIKVDIPVESIGGTLYLKQYADAILAMEARMEVRRPMPFVIMVSADTDGATRASLEGNGYFGLRASQVHVLRQELVPAVADNAGRLALGDRYELLMKPHGHGDIHMLLHTSGLARRLADAGIEHLVFIQDTNGQVFNAVPAALGVAVDEGFDFMSLAVNRIPGEAVGGLATLVRGESALTLNVEYNQLDPLLRATVSPEGDVPNEEGFSIFPGNINVLVIGMGAYVRILEETRGIIAEFVNPKYADAERRVFKKPTRLETMMQDLPKLFTAEQRVGVAVFDRVWCFSANKNRVADAVAKQLAGGPAESAATAEADFYEAGRMRLRAAGMEVEDAAAVRVQGIEFVPGPRVLLRPSFAMRLSEVRERVQGGAMADEATLILDGPDIRLEQVELRGCSGLVISAVPGAVVTVRGRFENAGFERVLLSGAEMADASVPETVRMRGFRMVDRGAAVFRFDEPGSYVVTPECG
jgi:UDP-sugar pyrophosphorylase